MSGSPDLDTATVFNSFTALRCLLSFAMGVCFSALGGTRDDKQCPQPEAFDLQRLPLQLLAHIFSLLPQREQLFIVPQVCKSWQQLARQGSCTLTVNLSSSACQLQLPQLLYWMEKSGQRLKQLQVSTNKPLGPHSRKALLRSLNCSQPSLYQSMALQLDLDIDDLKFITQRVCSNAPMLRSLQLQPVKPTYKDFQLLVLACILGSMVGADTSGPVLPHLADCSTAVEQLAASATQLQSLSLSRYHIGTTDCVSSATQLTSLCLQHCGLSDDSITGLTNLTRLQRLEVSDNLLTTVALQHIAVLTRLTHLDLSVMPAIQRMRGSHTADLQHLNKLQDLQVLNVIGFGVADASAISHLTHLTRLEIGLNPLNAASLRAMGQLASLQHLELGGLSQAWVLSSAPAVTAAEALRVHDACWYGLTGLKQLTYLDLGGSNFSSIVWISQVCPMLCALPCLNRLHLAHCHIPPGKLLPLLVGLRTPPGNQGTPQIADINLDRCSLHDPEYEALLQLTSLTKLSLACLSPRLGNQQASVLSQLTSLRSLSVRLNDLGSKGVERLGKGLTRLTCLDWSENPKIGKRVQKQFGHLMAVAEALHKAELETSFW